MGIYETLLKRRTIRRFKSKAIPYEILEKCVNAARLAPSARNQQSLEFVIIDDAQLLGKVFDTLRFASAIRPAGYPPPEQRAMAYIIILSRNEIALQAWVKCDVGFAAENMVLVAIEEGVGSCCVGLIKTRELGQILNIPDDYAIELVLALGYPDEQPVIAEITDDITMWEDKNTVLHIPKRKLAEVLHRNQF